MFVSNIDTVLFDLDGTLINSLPDLTIAVNATMYDLDREKHSQDTVKHWIGNGAKVLLKRALTGEYDGEPEQHLFDKALPLFFDHYAKNLVGASYVYDGVFPALELLKSSGIKLACVTNKPIEFAQPIINHFKLDQFIQVVIGGGSIPELKPSAAPLLLACEKLGGEPSLFAKTTVMVGDSASDIKAAKAANMKSVAVDYGYAQGQNLLELGAQDEISNMMELPDLLALY